MKPIYILLAAALPVIAIIGFRHFNNSEGKKANHNTNGQAQVNPQLKRTSEPVPSTSSVSSNDRDEQYNTRDEALNDITLKKVDLAMQATKLRASDFGRNGDFLLNKHQKLFDSWGLSSAERNEFVKILAEQSARMADVSLKSDVLWPLSVGDARNRKENTDHTVAKLNEFQRIQSETKQKLVGIVGADRVLEFEQQKNKQTKVNDD